MKSRNYLKFVSAIFLACFMLQASAQQSPMMTVLRKPHASVQIAPDAAEAMLKGFVSCDPRAALPAKFLSPLGVKFLDSKQAASIQFSTPVAEDVLLLLGNDSASLEIAPDGRYAIYGGKYRLKKRIQLGDELELTGVSEMVATYGAPRARVGVTYTFKGSAEEALARIESNLHVDLKSRTGRMPEPSAKEAWYTLGDDGHSAACWRFVD